MPDGPRIIIKLRTDLVPVPYQDSAQAGLTHKVEKSMCTWRMGNRAWVPEDAPTC